MDDNVPVIGDWIPPNHSPRTLFSEFIATECGSRFISDDSLQKTNDGSLPEWREPEDAVNGENQDCEPGIQVSKEISIEFNSSNVPKSSTRGGLSERIAGRAGFGNLTIDTSQIKKTTSFSSRATDVCSPLLTIPPGLSPTMLLGSPLLVSNSLAESSPTTGKIAFMECDNVSTAITSENTDHATKDVDPASFTFNLPLLYFSCAETMPALSIHPQQPNFQDGHSKLSGEKDSGDTLNSNHGRPPLDDPQEGDADPKGEYTSASVVVPIEDGFNWRKYGQKQVKGSEYPRSYYKCTHPNCQVKKKVERSHDGHITEIIYKGIHNHMKSSTNRRSSIPSSHPSNDLQIDCLEQNEWKQEELDANQYASVPIKQCEQSNPVQSRDGPYRETQDGIDASSLFSNDDDEEDEQGTHGSASLGGDDDGDETESKRRKLDACALGMSAASRAVREPRVVVQTTSEIDILDDGYRWRKYGQKVVKGNPNPRSYYKCTNPGCTVRKHVERASHDLKSVITTYEGKHIHEVPAARTGSQASSSAALSITATASPSSCLLHRKAEPIRMPDCLGRFDTPAPLGSFGLPSRNQQVGAAVPNFSFAMAHQGFNPNFAMAGLGNMTSLKMSVVPSLPAYMSHHHPGGVGFMMPNIVPKEELATNSGPPVSDGSSAYHWLSRMPLGPQL